MSDVLPDLFSRLKKLYDRLEAEGRVYKDAGSHSMSEEVSAPLHEVVPHKGLPFYYHLPFQNGTGEFFGVCLKNSAGQVNIHPSRKIADTDTRYVQFVSDIEAFLAANHA